jgi:nuclear transport factor 2 (NTF2) superfamily protein
MTTRPPVPPFTRETAVQNVRLAEDGWNSRDPEKVSLAYTPDSRWRNRAEFVNGRPEIVAFLTRKWTRELDHRLIKELWAFTGNRIAVRFAYEWRWSARTHGVRSGSATTAPNTSGSATASRRICSRTSPSRRASRPKPPSSAAQSRARACSQFTPGSAPPPSPPVSNNRCSPSPNAHWPPWTAHARRTRDRLSR